MTGPAARALVAFARAILRWCRSGWQVWTPETESGATGLASGAVTREVNVQVVAPADMPTQVPVVMRYDLAEPYAVCAKFPAPPSRGVSWVFARDLMSQGLRVPTGDGDVRIWPTERGGRSVRIALMSPDGDALVQADSSDVVEFLSQSYALCPPGTEGEHLDIDGALRMMLAS